MGAERHVHPHAEGGIVVAQRLLKFFEMGNRFPEQLRVKAPPRFHEALLRGVRVQVQHDFDAQAVAPAKLSIERRGGFSISPLVLCICLGLRASDFGFEAWRLVVLSRSSPDAREK